MSGLLRSASGVGEIQLCRAKYCVLTLPEVISIDLICQVVDVDGSLCAWVDGVDHAQPLLVGVEHLHEFKHIGTLGRYLRDEQHLSLGQSFDDLLDLCLSRDLSATVLVRACELMHADGLDAKTAVQSASEWGALMQEIDWDARQRSHRPN